MRKTFVLATAIAGMFVACLMIATGNAAPAKRAAAPKTETYSVIQVGEDIKVIKKSDLAALKKSNAEDYKRAMKEYNDAKKEAAKSKDKAADKTAIEKPVKQKIVDLAKKSFKTDQEATTWMENHLDSKKDQPKTDKKTEKKAAAQ
jgi:hypothetical protein